VKKKCEPLYVLGMSEPDPSLQQEILFALGNGMETTLLVLEMVSDSEVGPVLEAAVLQELVDMEAAGFGLSPDGARVGQA
jgi:hypothetical protein